MRLILGPFCNAVELLLKGYDLNDQIEPLLERYVRIEDMPKKDRRKNK